MALKLGLDLKNYIINQGIVKMMAGTMGTGGTASIKIYTGFQPASPEIEPTGTAGTLLCTIINIGWGGSNGTIGSTAGTVAFGTAGGYMGTSVISGTAGWARMQTVGLGFTGSAATFRIDGDIGTAATCTFVINAIAITGTSSVTILSAPISIP
jgi:hypothetical protein